MPSPLYPEIAAFEHGWLDVGHGHQIYWEVSGNPNGRPALILHGGPGSGLSQTARRYFDPSVFRIVQFDQRNCGRSLPHASTPKLDLSTNTTAHLLSDIEALRIHLGIESWLILGGSWGSTLALSYAQAHASRVTALVLNSIATTTAEEIDWITRGLASFFPREWLDFRNHLPENRRDGDLASAYNQLLMNPDPAIHQPAADHWCAWESAIVDIHPKHRPHPRWQDPRFRLCFARLVTHYWSNRGFLADRQLLQGISRIAHIPADLIHGRLDLTGPLHIAFELHQAWPGSRLTVIPAAGHDSRDPGMEETIAEAIHRQSLVSDERNLRLKNRQIEPIAAANSQLK